MLTRHMTIITNPKTIIVNDKQQEKTVAHKNISLYWIIIIIKKEQRILLRLIYYYFTFII